MRDRTERQVSSPAPIGDVAAGFLQKAEIPKNFKAAIGKSENSVDREKTSFSLSVEAKFKLATLKADLRRRGHRITESLIVEKLIEKANSDELLAG
jgi:hypothetical protein